MAWVKMSHGKHGVLAVAQQKAEVAGLGFLTFGLHPLAEVVRFSSVVFSPRHSANSA